MPTAGSCGGVVAARLEQARYESVTNAAHGEAVGDVEPPDCDRSNVRRKRLIGSGKGLSVSEVHAAMMMGAESVRRASFANTGAGESGSPRSFAMRTPPRCPADSLRGPVRETSSQRHF